MIKKKKKNQNLWRSESPDNSIIGAWGGDLNKRESSYSFPTKRKHFNFLFEPNKQQLIDHSSPTNLILPLSISISLFLIHTQTYLHDLCVLFSCFIFGKGIIFTKMGSIYFANYQTLKPFPSFNSFLHFKQPCIVSLYHHSNKVQPSLSLPRGSSFCRASGLISNSAPVNPFFPSSFFLLEEIFFYMGSNDFVLLFWVVEKRKFYGGWFYDQKRELTRCQNYNQCGWRYYWYLFYHIYVIFFIFHC